MYTDSKKHLTSYDLNTVFSQCLILINHIKSMSKNPSKFAVTLFISNENLGIFLLRSFLQIPCFAQISYTSASKTSVRVIALVLMSLVELRKSVSFSNPFNSSLVGSETFKVFGMNYKRKL